MQKCTRPLGAYCAWCTLSLMFINELHQCPFSLTPPFLAVLVVTHEMLPTKLVGHGVN